MSDGRAQAAVGTRIDHAADLDDDLRGGQPGVDAQLGGGGAGMGGAAVEGDLLPGDRLDAGDDADLPVLLGQHGPLFDMAFEVDVRRVEADRTLTLEADALELVAEPVALGIGEPIGMVEAQPSSGHRGAEHVRAEPDSLFLRPGRDDDRTAGTQPRLVEGPEDGEAAEDAEAAVEGTGGGHGVDVRADEDRVELGVLPFSASEDRAHLIDGDLEAELLHPRTQQFATGPVLIGQRLAVDADEAGRLIVIGADRGELHEIVPQTICVDGQFRGRIGDTHQGSSHCALLSMAQASLALDSRLWPATHEIDRLTPTITHEIYS